MKRKIVELILILIFYLLQVTLCRFIDIDGVSPNFLIILPVIFGFFCGKNEGMFVGFFSGLMYDLFFSSILGFTSLVFIYIGYIAGLFSHKYEENEILIPLGLLMASDFSYMFLSYIFNFLLYNRLNVWFYMSEVILPEVIYTLLIFIALYKPLSYINEKLGVA